MTAKARAGGLLTRKSLQIVSLCSVELLNRLTDERMMHMCGRSVHELVTHFSDNANKIIELYRGKNT
jgi:hypothetical protein